MNEPSQDFGEVLFGKESGIQFSGRFDASFPLKELTEPDSPRSF